MNKPWPWAWQWGELLLPLASCVTWEVRLSLVLLGAQAAYIKLLGKRQIGILSTAVNLARPLPREDSGLGQMVAPLSKGLENENGVPSLESWAHTHKAWG